MVASAEPSSRDFEETARTLIELESTLTLATVGVEGPWSAPVYYVFLDGRFYFFSATDSRHIRQALSSGQAAASLYHQAEGWKSIRGIQMAGTVARVRSVHTAAKVVNRYLKRFAFTRQFFPADEKPDVKAFANRFRARLYAFSPSDLYVTDNRFGFGSRRRIEPWRLVASATA